MYQANRTGPWTAGPPDGNAFPALSVLTNRSPSIITKAQTQKAMDYLPADVHPNVLAGFDAQRQLLIKALQDPKRAAYELLNFNYGVFSNVNMRPFSRGTVKASSIFRFGPVNIAHVFPVDLITSIRSSDHRSSVWLKSSRPRRFASLDRVQPPSACHGTNETATATAAQSQTKCHRSGDIGLHQGQCTNRISPQWYLRHAAP
jgi:hypothetical protein